MKNFLIITLVISLLLVGCQTIKSKPTIDSNRYTVHIVHGFGATPNDHWFRWLEKNLIQQGYSVDNIALPNSKNPNFDEWQSTLAKHINVPNSSDIFVSHSLGNISLLHYLSQKPINCIGGLILVSGFENKLPKLSKIDNFNVDNYVEKAKVDNQKIMQLTSNIYSIISDNDYLVDPKESKKLANNLNSQIYVVNKGGHFLAEDGFTQLPIVLNTINELKPKNCNGILNQDSQ